MNIGGRTCSWAFAIFGRQAKLSPRLALCYAWVDNLAVCGKAYPASGLDLPAVVVKSPAHDGLSSVFVGGLGVGGELIGGIVEVFVICPVRATVGTLDGGLKRWLLRDRSLLC